MSNTSNSTDTTETGHYFSSESKTNSINQENRDSTVDLDFHHFNNFDSLAQILLQPSNKESVLDYYKEVGTDFSRTHCQSTFKNLRTLCWCFPEAQITIDARADSETLHKENLRLLEYLFKNTEKLKSKVGGQDSEKLNFGVEEKVKVCGPECKAKMSTKSFRPDISKFSCIEKFTKAFDLFLKLEKVVDKKEQALHYQLALASHEKWSVICDANSTAEIEYDTLKGLVIKAIKPEAGMQMAEIMKEMTNLTQQSPSESDLHAYYDRFLYISNLSAASDIADKVKVVLFAENLYHSKEVKPVKTNETITDIFLRAKVFATSNSEAINYQNTSPANNRNQFQQRPFANRHQTNRNKNFSKFNGKPQKMVCSYCKKVGHSANRCFKKQRNDFRAQHEEIVRNFELMDLKMVEAIENQENEVDAEDYSEDDQSDAQELVGVTNGTSSIQINQMNLTIKKLLSQEPLPLAKCAITKVSPNGQKRTLEGYIDSGASRSVVCEAYTKVSGLKIFPRPDTIVRGFDGEISQNVLGQTSMTIQIAGRNLEIHPLVIRGRDDNLFGVDILTEFPGRFFTRRGKLNFQFSKPENLANVHAKTKTVIPPLSSKVVAIKKLDHFKTREVMISQLSTQTKFITPNAVADEKCDRIIIINPSEKPYVINEGQKIAEVSALATDTGVLSKKSKNPKYVSEEDFLKMIDVKVEHMAEDDRKYVEGLKQLLIKHQKAFDVRADSEIGHYKKRKINLNPSGRKIKVEPQKRRNFPPSVWSKANVEIDLLWKNDLVENSENCTSQPANIVLAKRSGSSRDRLCMDYRRLNLVLDDCFHPMPSLESIMSKIGRFEVLSNVDLANCFWAYELEESCRDLTSFYTEDSVLRWKRLPFGVKSGSQWAQKLASAIILEESFKLKLGKCSVLSLFIDDLLLSGLKADHLNDLDQLFTVLGENGLVMRFEKCNFWKKEQKFIGMKIAVPGTIQIDDEFLEGLDNLRLPQDTREVRSFLGMFQWRHNFLEKFFDAASPLYDLLKGTNVKKVEKVDLGKKEIEAFQNVIEIAKQDVKLTIPRFDKDAPAFEIETDASQIAYSAALKQGDNVLAYASKSMSKAGRNFENMHREASAVIWAVTEKFRDIILYAPKKTILHTDNKIVSFLKSATNPKLIRWRNLLANYNLDIRHRKGVNMTLADPLSRLVNVAETTENDKLPESMQNDLVIANLEPKPNKNNTDLDVKLTCDILCFHFKENHCSSENLKKIYPDLASLEKIDQVTKNCLHCMTKKTVMRKSQIPGSVFDADDGLGKNVAWYADITFPKIKGKTLKILTILDRDSDRFFARELLTRSHKSICSKLQAVMSDVGVPKKLIADGEFDSAELTKLASQFDFEIEIIPRETPNVNIIERKHREFKKIWTLNEQLSLSEVVLQLNRLKKVAGMNTNVSPEEMYMNNDVNAMEKLRQIRLLKSEQRKERCIELRGRNIDLFKREFEVDDFVKFTALADRQDIRFGTVLTKKSKFYQIKELKSNKLFNIHAKDLELLPKENQKIVNDFIR